MPSSTPLYRAQALVQFASTLLQRAGMGTSQADCVANTLVDSFVQRAEAVYGAR